MSEASLFIQLIWSALFNGIFVILFFLVYKNPFVNFLRRFLYAKKGYGIVNLIGRDKRVVEYFTKIIGEKIRIKKRTYITSPDALLISSQVNEIINLPKNKQTYKQKIDEDLKKLYKLKEQSDMTSKFKNIPFFNKDRKNLLKKIKAYEEAKEIEYIGDTDQKRMLLKGNMPTYFFKEGNIEPLDLIDMRMGDISSKHMDDIIVDALTAPKVGMFSWFEENKRMLMYLLIGITVLIFVAVNYIQGQPGGLEGFLVG